MNNKISTFYEYLNCIVESKGKREATGEIHLMNNGKLMYIGVYENFTDNFTLEFDIDALKPPFLLGEAFGGRLFMGIYSANDSIGFIISQDDFKKFTGWLEMSFGRHNML